MLKYASAAIMTADLAPIHGSRRDLRRFAHRHHFEHTPRPGYLYVRSRAISSRCNDNFDEFPAEELEKSWHTFIGKPVFVNHVNHDHQRARGVIIDAALHKDYNRDGTKDWWVELLQEVDAIRFPKLAREILAGNIARTSMGCFVPGTLVTLADGTQKPIEIIALGDDVLTHTGKTEPVTYVMKRDYDGIVYDVRTYGQSTPLVMTEEHPVWVKRPAQEYGESTGRKVRSLDADTCSCGKQFDSWRSLTAHVREAKRWGWEGTHEIPQVRKETVGWVEAKDLRPGDWVLTPVPEQTGHPGTYPFARLLGFYAAEGNLGWDRKRRPEGPVSVEWSFDAGGVKNEIEHVKEIVTLLAAMGYQAAGPYTKNNAYSIRCNSPELADRFLAYGGRHSWAKRLHPEVLRWDKDNQRALLDAYLLGDGSFRNDDHFEASTASEQMSRQLHLMAVRAGVPMTPPIRQHSPSAVKAGRRPKYVMQGRLEPLATPERSGLAYVDENGLWRRITDIVMKTYRGPVHNFDVEGDDSYVAADVAVHNCDVAFSVCSACGNKATTPAEYCQHIPGSKGVMLYRRTASGQKVGEIIRETCYGLKFFENSLLVEPPADPTAFFTGVDTRGLNMTAAASEKTAAHAMPYQATPRHAQASLALPNQHTANLDTMRAKRIDLADLGKRAQAMRKKAISDEEIQQGLGLPTSEQGKKDLHQEKVKNLGDALMAPFYEPYGGEEGYDLHRTNEDMMDLHRRYEGGDGKFGFGGGEAYYQIDHRNPQGKKTGWFIRHYADGPNAEIGHEATPGESHESYDIGENTYGPDSGGLMGHSRPPEQFGHQHLKKLLDNWHNNVDEDGEEQGGTREYMEGPYGDPRIRRYKRINRLAYGETKAPADVDTLREDACPVCNDRDTYDGDTCQVCGYVSPPEMFQDPDLEKARQMDLRKDIAEFQDPNNPNQIGPDGQPLDPSALDENGNPIDPDAADQGQQPGTLPGEVQVEVQPGGQMDPNASGEERQIPEESGAPVDPNMLGPDGQPLPGGQQMVAPDGTPIGPQVLPNDAKDHMGQPFYPGPNMPKRPGEPEGPEGPMGPEDLDVDGQQPNPDAGGGFPGTPGDGVPDLMCPACGFSADASQPVSVDMDAQTLPETGGDGTQAGDVCPNCGSAQLVSPAQAQGETPVPIPK